VSELELLSQTHFTRSQSLYAAPCIKDFWSKMKTMFWEAYKDKSVILSGDGRMDSPGFCAKYYLYVMMDTFLNVILDRLKLLIREKQVEHQC
jgi:hypothetical protein